MKADSALVETVSPSPNFGDRRGRAVDALILHYTGMSTGELARTRLLAPESEVSCHYLVWEDGHIEQLVAEADRAWHAGRSCWAGETDMNTVSIGIEIVNAGHDGGRPPYPGAQIEGLIVLCQDICTRHGLMKRRVLGHSDIAPARKLDPGEWFPWRRLAAAGVGVWVEAPPTENAPCPEPGSSGQSVLSLQKQLGAYGYACPATGIFDAATTSVVAAFQRHFRPARVDGVVDGQTLGTLSALQPRW